MYNSIILISTISDNATLLTAAVKIFLPLGIINYGIIVIINSL